MKVLSLQHQISINPFQKELLIRYLILASRLNVIIKKILNFFVLKKPIVDSGDVNYPSFR